MTSAVKRVYRSSPGNQPEEMPLWLPKGQDHATGQACVVCNRNSLDRQPYPVASGSVPASIPRSIVSSFQVRVPLQGGDLGVITGGAQIGTFGVHKGESWKALIGQRGAK